MKPELADWQEAARSSDRQEDLGYMALLLFSVSDRRVPAEASERLYAVAEALLGRPELEPYTRWLRIGMLDVNRLSAHLDHVLMLQRLSGSARGPVS